MRRPLIVCFILLAAAGLFAATEVRNTRVYTDPKSGLTLVSGEIELPLYGAWSVLDAGAASRLFHVHVMGSKEGMERLKGERAQKAELAQKVQEGQYKISSLYWPCSQFASTNRGVGPGAWSDLGTNQFKHYLSQSSNYFLIPNVSISNAPARFGSQPSTGNVVIVELNPYIDDGKYWVVLSNGQTERRAIDKDLVSRYGLVIKPERSAEVKPAPREGETGVSRIYALCQADGSAGKPENIQIRNTRTGSVIECRWDYSNAGAASAADMSEWSSLRGGMWSYMAYQSDSPALPSWLEIQGRQFGSSASMRQGGRGGRGEQTDMFGVLGGRAAIRETLQMQGLTSSGSRSSGRPMLPVSQVKELEVKSHPFGEMLKGAKGGSLPFADNAPADHLFVYVAKPQALIPFLNAGNDFLFRAGLPLAGNNISYELKTKYLAKLGISEGWMKLALATGGIKEVGIILPDLFLLDGTEMTVIARVPSARLLRPVFESIGLSDLDGGIKVLPVKNGGQAYWSLRDDFLAFSTSRKELETVISLHAERGKGSLGQSAEFRYMLTQLPVVPDTRFHVYISDSFIRKLVGPQAKIAQLRRLRVRRDLERLSSAALLYKVDRQKGPADIGSLVAKGYITTEQVSGDYSLKESAAAVSAMYGTPADMKSLLENPVTEVTQEEADEYKLYVENYSRFWRQFFDPIAMRLDDTGGDGLCLTTYILPLIDCSVYNSIRDVVASREGGKTLSLPELAPQPVAMLSLNLQDDAWVKTTRSFLSGFARFARIDESVFDELGPSVHLAIQDSDPVISVGSGDVLGMFGGNMAMMQGGQMLAIPMLVSILTRPCNLMVELKNPAKVVSALQAASSYSGFAQEGRNNPGINYYKMDGRDGWICLVDLLGLAKLRFGVEVREGFLLINNIPWSSRPVTMNVHKADLNGAMMTVRPEASKLQMPGLFTSTMENYRSAAMKGLGCLKPILDSGAQNVSDAIAIHKALYGFAPEHPGAGTWLVENGELRSSVFGTIGKQIQPEYKAGNEDFGSFNGIDEMAVNIQFEDTGLRVKTSWKCRKQ